MRKAFASAISAFNFKIFFVFAVFAVVFFLTIGMPNPPGLLYKVSESYLQSHPGYSDIKTGSINPALLDQNVDKYNSYLMAVIVIICLNLIGYYFLFVLASVVVWNYVQKNGLSVSGFWRAFWFNLLWLLLATFIAILAYGAFTFVGSVGPTWWGVAMTLLFALSVSILVMLTLICNYNLQRQLTALDSFVHSLRSLKSHFLKLMAGVVGLFVVLFVVSLLFYVPAISFALVTAIVTLLQLFGFAWLHLYVNAILLSEKSKK